MDIYDLLGEDRSAPEHRHSQALVAAQDQLMHDLVAARESAGLTQEQVAELMGTNQGTISRFESRTTDARMSTLRRYAKAVGVTISYEVTPFSETETHPLGASLRPYAWSTTPSQPRSTQ
ncbi:helix-turn-helix domain-containing protein [Actinomyces urogenitalis]|uniref:helix-turn-helix domain-containing protein n=1 Tax=Actinomyces urogenitalis TaxID=103621 RepID=UPI002430A846|nr:helix-turn-helix transcriptional regulator [Actinomyces urogenitalis]MCI7457751.1 helix-turn-helix domain-containing protein [Actinomyces urogenitalis]